MYGVWTPKRKGNLKIIILLEISKSSAIKSNAKSIAFASAVKIEEPSGIRIFSEKCQIPAHNQLSYHHLSRQYKNVYN